METLDQLQQQLNQLGELRSIVTTMKALSAASIRQFEHAVDAIGSYHETVERGLKVVLEDIPSLSAVEPEIASEQYTLIVFGSDHGLCGRFNEAIADYALNRSDAFGVANERHSILAVGSRVAAALERRNVSITAILSLPGSADQITERVQNVLLRLDEWHAGSASPVVDLVYHRHQGTTNHQPVRRRLLPLGHEHLQSIRQTPWPSNNLPTFTIERNRLLQNLVQQYLFVAVFRAFAESQASEHAGRLTAMQSAQRNLDERLDEVTQVYGRARQGEITAELLDVVAGFEAITGTRD